MRRFNEAASWLAQSGFNRRVFRQYDLHRAFYRELRARWGLSSQMTVRCIAVVAAQFKRDRAVMPVFRADAAVPYDSRILSFKANAQVALLSLSGRLIVPFVCGKRQRILLANPIGECDLVHRKGCWYLHCSVEVEEPGGPLPRAFLGVDVGVANIAATSDGAMFSGTQVDRVRRGYAEKRRRLQIKAAAQRETGKRPKNVRRKLKRIAQTESLFRKDVNHCISKKLVALAEGTGRGIAIENLVGIRARTRFRKSQRARMSSWSFAQLRAFIEYKAALRGVLDFAVIARYSSQQCSQCRCLDKANRRTQSDFRCVRCGYAEHADVNAAKNLSYRAEVSLPIVSMFVLLHEYSGTSPGVHAEVA